MLPAERHKVIVDFILQNGSASIEQLVELTGTSVATVRRDLALLDEQRLIKRTHGGAVRPLLGSHQERTYSEKRLINSEAKAAIGALAASLVKDGDTVILDSGSTTYAVAQHLTRKRDLTILTNDLMIATLDFPPTTTVIVAGGVRRSGFHITVGSMAESFFSEVNADWTFLGADAIDVERGITNASPAEVRIKQLMIEAGQEVVLVADHSKFGKVAMMRVAPLSAVDVIVTDSGLDPRMRDRLVQAGAELKVTS